MYLKALRDKCNEKWVSQGGTGTSSMYLKVLRDKCNEIGRASWRERVLDRV